MSKLKSVIVKNCPCIKNNICQTYTKPCASQKCIIKDVLCVPHNRLKYLENKLCNGWDITPETKMWRKEELLLCGGTMANLLDVEIVEG